MSATSSKSENFGKATYLTGRGKNKVLTYMSKKSKTLVYEFMVASKFKTPGLVSWKCVSCAKLKNDYRSMGSKLNKKIPLILVDNDIIKEDPERPLNAEHFCTGKDIIESVVNRSRLEFLSRQEPMDKATLHSEVLEFSKTLGEQGQFPLNPKEKKMVQRYIVGNIPTLYEGAQRRRDFKRGIRKEFFYGFPNPNKKKNAHGTLLLPVATRSEPPKSSPEPRVSEFVEVCYEDDDEQGTSTGVYYTSDGPSTSAEELVEEIIVEEIEEVIETCDPPPPLSPQQNVHGDMVYGDMQHVAYDIELG